MSVPHESPAATSDEPSRPPIYAPAEGQRRIEAWGTRVTLLATAIETGGRYTMLDYVTPANGVRPPLHLHREMEESFYVLAGNIHFQVGDQTLIAGPCAFVHAPPNTPHAFWNESDTPARMILTFSPCGFEEYFVEVQALAQEHPVQTPEVRPLIGQILAKYDVVVLGSSPKND